MPSAGFEPAPSGLGGRCSSIELRGQNAGLAYYERMEICHGAYRQRVRSMVGLSIPRRSKGFRRYRPRLVRDSNPRSPP